MGESIRGKRSSVKSPCRVWRITFCMMRSSRRQRIGCAIWWPQQTATTPSSTHLGQSCLRAMTKSVYSSMNYLVQMTRRKTKTAKNLSLYITRWIRSRWPHMIRKTVRSCARMETTLPWTLSAVRRVRGKFTSTHGLRWTSASMALSDTRATKSLVWRSTRKYPFCKTLFLLVVIWQNESWFGTNTMERCMRGRRCLRACQKPWCRMPCARKISFKSYGVWPSYPRLWTYSEKLTFYTSWLLILRANRCESC